jgi:hypothetical protein
METVLGSSPVEADAKEGESAVFDAVVALGEQASRFDSKRIASDSAAAAGFKMIVENDNAPATASRGQPQLGLDFTPLIALLIIYILSLYFTF